MADDIKLPEPAFRLLKSGALIEVEPALPAFGIPDGEHRLYTADQVRAAVEAERARLVPLTDEQVYRVVSGIGPDVMELAEQWADNEIHSYSLTHQAEVLAAAIVRRTEAAHGITETKGGSDA